MVKPIAKMKTKTNLEVKTMYYVCNYKGRLQNLNKMFESLDSAIKYYRDLSETYPHVEFYVHKNQTYGGHFEEDVTPK